jgi:condensin complex subunit 1
MDVDDEEAESNRGESVDAEEDEDEPMDGDEEEDEPRPKKHKKKAKKGRKSELNMEALQNEAVAVAALQGDQLAQLRLKKRYHAECLNFIRQIEGGMKIIEDLLASNSKAEVLEAMEFFRVIHEYQFDGAEVSSVVQCPCVSPLTVR